MNEVPVTGKTIIETINEGLRWLDRQIEMIVGPAQPVPAPAAAALTDVQLHRAIHDIGATLLNRHGLLLQDSFARYGATFGDPRFPAALPATVRSHVLMMITQASDSYGIALLGLREHATASALGPIRNVAETYAYAKWLLESPDEDVRLGRAYRLTMDAIDQFREQKRLYLDLCDLVEPVLGWPGWKALTGQIRTRLEPLAQEAEQRHLGRIQDDMANAQTWADPPVARQSLAWNGRYDS